MQDVGIRKDVGESGRREISGEMQVTTGIEALRGTTTRIRRSDGNLAKLEDLSGSGPQGPPGQDWATGRC